jgi:SAM-dependent methyltransferase
MVELLDPAPGQRILDLAAGPGETGFKVLPLIQPGGELLSTDAAPEMVEVARRRAATLGLKGIEFAVEDAANLTLHDDSVDGIICRFGVMLVPDMEGAAAEIARILRPDGRVVLAVWASSRVNPWITAGGRAALDLGFTDPPDYDAPGPFRLSEPALLRSVIEGGGLEVELIEEVAVTWEAESAEAWWNATRDTSRMLATLLERLTPAEVAALRERAQELLQEFAAPDGSLSVPGIARVVLAVPARGRR